MDLPSFISLLQKWTRFPRSVVEQAEKTAGLIDDEGRDFLQQEIEKSYAEYAALDDTRLALEAKILQDFETFRKETLPQITRAIESEEHTNADSILNAAIESQP